MYYRKKRHIIDSSPGAIQSTGSYFFLVKVMQKRNFRISVKAIDERQEREKPVNLVIIGVISTLRPITNHDDAIPLEKKRTRATSTWALMCIRQSDWIIVIHWLLHATVTAQHRHCLWIIVNLWVRGSNSCIEKNDFKRSLFSFLMLVVLSASSCIFEMNEIM